MAGVETEEAGPGKSFEGFSSEQQQCQSGEALAEWRSSEQVENGSPSTSPPYWDTDDDEDTGPKPCDLYGKYTWKIDKFSQLNKRELRSNAFEVGGYKWYILIYPQGCDVCNHLSLFLCVANHDKLLPGWSHFAQFTIAVVNKDPKKSKYSDTLHRFWKKEHDWGWKKFMELSKLLDGFIDADVLTIKAQVQVIRERAERPFRCLDCHYRRELVRVYLTNVEQICRRFVEERRSRLGKLLEDKVRWSSFCAFWLGMDQSSKRRMSREKTESILKVVVKHFFIEKEVTSTLVMDSLHSGLKALEGQNKGKKSKGKDKSFEVEEPVPIICIDKDTFILVDDVLLLLERAAVEPLPPKDDKGPQNRTKDGTAGEELNKDSIECDERRLTELGRRTIEIFILSHIFSKIEVSYQEAVALRKQEELIREEEEAWLAEIEQKARRATAEKEKKSKKKQGKQKRNNRKAKDKGRDESSCGIVQNKNEQGSHTVERKYTADHEIFLEKSDVVEDVSDLSDSVDCIPEILPIDSKERYTGSVNWDPDTTEVHPPSEASSNKASGISVVQIRVNGRSSSTVDDSSSTCSSDSFPSLVLPQNGNFLHHKSKKSPSRVRDHKVKSISDTDAWVNEGTTVLSESVADARQANSVSRSLSTNGSQSQIVAPLQDEGVHGIERHMKKKEKETETSHSKDAVDDKTNRDRVAFRTSPSKSTTKSITAVASPKSDLKSNYASDEALQKKSPLDELKQPDNLGDLANSAVSKSDPLKFTTSQPAEKAVRYQMHLRCEKLQAEEVSAVIDKASAPLIPELSRTLSAPLVPGPRPAVSFVSVVQTAPVLSRSVSATGRLGQEPSASAIPSYVSQSYRNAMMGGSSAAYAVNHSASSVGNALHSYSNTPALVSSPIEPSLPFGMVNQSVLLNGSPRIENPQGGACQNLPVDRSSLINNIQSYDLFNLLQTRSPDHSLSEFPACTSGRQGHVVPDEFPHLDIINELLEDEHGIGMVARGNSGYQSFINELPMDRHYSLLGEPSSMLNGFGLAGGSCRFDRSQSYRDNLLGRGYVASVNACDNTIGDVIPQFSSRPYLDARIDGFIPNQWQMPGTDMPFLGVRNKENDAYPYQVHEYPNLKVGINGYTVFRPSNGL